MKEIYRMLAIRQGAGIDDADQWAKEMVALPALVERSEKRRKEHEARVAEGRAKPGAFHPVSEWAPWSARTMRFVWNRVKDEVAPWWAENSKEVYSSAFEALATAFTNYFDSRDGKRKGSPVGWPRYKGRRGRQSVSFTTGAINVLDRHHVQLPVVGELRVKEPTDKLRLRTLAGTARILRATLVSEGAKTYVSFAVIAKRAAPAHAPAGVAGHDVGISALVTSSDGAVVKNPRAAKQAGKHISRYQRRMDRQHRAGSPACVNLDGTHVKGACHWNTRSKRSGKNQARIARAHDRAANIRRDAIHKASYRAATTYAVNMVEDLNADGMGRKGNGKRGFNRAVKDASLAEYRRQLSYKSAWYGSALWLAAWWYASSKTCSRCRVKNTKLSRSARVFTCPSCGLVIDRDLNAARNLAALAGLACVCLMAQLMTGTPVNWSKLPIRAYGWEPTKDTRSSRESARAGGHKAEGGGRETSRRSPAGYRPFDREAAKPPASSEARQSEVA